MLAEKPLIIIIIIGTFRPARFVRVPHFSTPIYMTPYDLFRSRQHATLHPKFSVPTQTSTEFFREANVLAETTCAALPLSFTERRGAIGKIEQHTVKHQPHSTQTSH